jgi:hypothetical protein
MNESFAISAGGHLRLGIVGSLVGGFLGGLVSKPKEGSKFHGTGFVLSVVGAVVVLLIWRFARSWEPIAARTEQGGAIIKEWVVRGDVSTWRLVSS